MSAGFRPSIVLKAGIPPRSCPVGAGVANPRDAGGPAMGGYDHPMELRQVRYFCAVAEEGHLGRAAERLGVRSPSLSQQIRVLEGRLGAQLFERTPAGMVLSRAGRALLPEARATLAAADRAARVVEDAGKRLEVGIPPGLPPGVPPRVQDAARAAGTRVSFVDAGTAHQLSLLARRELDAGVVNLPADTTGMAVSVVQDVPLGVVMSAAASLADRAAVSWDDLAGHELLWFRRDRAPGYHDAVLNACHAGGWRPRLRVSAARRAVTRAELAGGPVVALQPESVHSGDASLAWRPLANGAPRMRVALAWRGDERHPVFSAIARDLAS
ncbi:LysR substrate-binding domain-containing protein [Nocardiopsis rhodophaea]